MIITLAILKLQLIMRLEKQMFGCLDLKSYIAENSDGGKIYTILWIFF